MGRTEMGVGAVALMGFLLVHLFGTVDIQHGTQMIPL